MDDPEAALRIAQRDLNTAAHSFDESLELFRERILRLREVVSRPDVVAFIGDSQSNITGESAESIRAWCDNTVAMLENIYREHYIQAIQSLPTNKIRKKGNIGKGLAKLIPEGYRGANSGERDAPDA